MRGYPLDNRTTSGSNGFAKCVNLDERMEESQQSETFSRIARASWHESISNTLCSSSHFMHRHVTTLPYTRYHDQVNLPISYKPSYPVLNHPQLLYPVTLRTQPALPLPTHLDMSQRESLLVIPRLDCLPTSAFDDCSLEVTHRKCPRRKRHQCISKHSCHTSSCRCPFTSRRGVVCLYTPACI